MKNVAARVIPLLVVSLLFSCGRQAPSSTAGFSWPRWRGPDASGVSAEADWNPRALADHPRLLWKASVGSGYSSEVIQDGLLYTMGATPEKETVWCLDAGSGRVVWTYSYPPQERPPQSTPTLDEGLVYTLGTRGLLLCLDAKTGRLRWQKDIAREYAAVAPFHGFAGSPVIEKDLVILTANTAGIAVHKKTGDLAWTSAPPPSDQSKLPPTNSSGYSGVEYETPVIFETGGLRAAAIFSYLGLHAVDAATGKMLWVFPWTTLGVNGCDPLVFGGRMYISTGRPVGDALLDIENAKPRVIWKGNSLSTDWVPPILIDGFIYGSDGQGGLPGDLRCIEATTGKVMWSKGMGGTIYLSAASGKLIVLNEKGKLFIVEATPDGYREFSSARIPGQKVHAGWWSTPTLCGGRIYCRNIPGDLVCIDVRK